MSRTVRLPARTSAARALSVALAVVAAAGLIFGSGGFTAMSVDRGVNVDVADDEDAYLGYELTTETTATNNTSTVTAEATYRNGFGGELTLDVTVVVDGDEVGSETITLDPGAEASISVTRSCSAGETIVFAFEAAGRGPGVSVSMDRARSVSCG
jgi:type II secretory pathway pseudopilin PulG